MEETSVEHRDPNRTIELTKTFNAPIQLVWDTWTKPEHIKNWWSPKGMTTQIKTYDFKEGGHWRYVMQLPDGQEFIAEGRFEQIEPGVKMTTEAHFRPKTENVRLCAYLAKEGALTSFRLQVVHPSETYKIEQERMGVTKGWEAAMERFGELIWNLA